MLLTTILLAASIFFGCGDKSIPVAPPSVSDIVGKWTITQSHDIITTQVHRSDSLPDSTFTRDTTITASGTDDFARFDSSMTYRIQTDIATFGVYGPKSDSGTWSLSGSSLQMISINRTDTTTVSANVTGKNGTFVFTSTTIYPIVSIRITISTEAIISSVKQ
jgi:hypothetical protein